MEKEIKAIYYFIDIGVISLLAIFGFALGISKWMGVLGITFMTFFQVFISIHLNNKNKH